MCCNYLDGETWREEHGGDRKSGQRTNECLPYFSPTLTTIIRHKLCVCVWHWNVPTGGENIHVFSLLLPWFVYFVLSKRWCQRCVATTQQRLCEKSCTVKNNMKNKWLGLCLLFITFANSRADVLSLWPYIRTISKLMFSVFNVFSSDRFKTTINVDSHHFYVILTF